MSGMMTATRTNRKRSHDDLEDRDECLPISKRINSLHLEAQAQVHGVILPEEQHGSPYAGICNHMSGANSSNVLNHLSPDLGPAHSPSSVGPLSRRSYLHVSQLSPVCEQISPNASHLNVDPLSLQAHLHSPVNENHPLSSLLNSDTQHQPYPLHSGMSHLAAVPTSMPMTHASVAQSVPDMSTNPSHLCDSINSHTQALLGMPDNTARGNLPVQVPMFFNNNLAVTETDLSLQQIPTGPYAPELDASENPHYFTVNQLLYEAHLCRMEREST